MKQWILLVSMGLLRFHSQAQTDTLSISMAQAVEMGLAGRFDYKADQIAVTIAANEVSVQKDHWLPELNGSGTLTYNTQEPSTYIPKGFIGSEAVLVTFASRNATVLGLTLNQPIYDPGLSDDLRIARNQVAWEKERLRGTAIEVKWLISQAYLNAQLKSLQWQITLAEEARYLAYFKLAEGKYKQEALIRNDYLHAQLDYQNAQLQTVVSHQDYSLALAQLAYQMNISALTPMKLTDTLDLRDSPVQAGGQRTELLQLQWQAREYQLEEKKIKRSSLPSLSFDAGFSQQFYSDDFHYGDGAWWSPYSYLGLRLSIPLTGLYTHKRQAETYALKATQADWTLKQTEADIDHEVLETSTELDNALIQVRMTKESYRLSQLVYQNSAQQFELGSFNYDHLLDTEKSITASERNYIQAVYAYLKAKLAYARARGDYRKPRRAGVPSWVRSPLLRGV